MNLSSSQVSWGIEVWRRQCVARESPDVEPRVGRELGSRPFPNLLDYVDEEVEPTISKVKVYMNPVTLSVQKPNLFLVGFG